MLLLCFVCCAQSLCVHTQSLYIEMIDNYLRVHELLCLWCYDVRFSILHCVLCYVLLVVCSVLCVVCFVVCCVFFVISSMLFSLLSCVIFCVSYVLFCCGVCFSVLSFGLCVVCY